jgi:hypothetical protein
VRGEEADARTDIFAFGAVLYEMLSGQRPFKRDTPIETMNAILTEDPPDLAEQLPHLAPALERIVRRCLEKQPDNRFQSAKDLAFAIENAGSTSSSAIRHAGGLAAAPRFGWRRALPWAVAALSVVVALYALVSARRATPDLPGAKGSRAGLRKVELYLPPATAQDAAPGVTDVTRDGQRFVMVQTVKTNSAAAPALTPSALLVENWAEEFRAPAVNGRRVKN